MAGDDCVANHIDLSNFRPVVRFYWWKPSAVSLGVHQSANAVDWQRCAAHGWDVVRRPTGGRALLHDGDLSYSVTLEGGSQSPHRLKELYGAVAAAWIETFAKFGIVADLVRPSRTVPENLAHLKDGLCLDSKVRGELVAQNRKITAAAQRVYPLTILQHGSVTLKGDVASISDVLPADEAARELATIKLRHSATSIAELITEGITADELISAAIDPFARNLNLKLEKDSWHDDELAYIDSHQSFHDVFSINSPTLSMINV